MRTKSVHANICIVAVGLLAACADTPVPTQPSQTSPPSQGLPPTNPPNAALSVKAVTIDGPGTVPPGETAQLRATATFLDGSSRDVTAEARWTSWSETVLSVDASGVVKGLDKGEATVTVVFGGHGSQHKEVVVVPAGTYRLRGWVREGGATIVAARVEVVGGTASGLATMSDVYGRYDLYGVSSDAQIRVTREGFEPYVRDVHLEPNSQNSGILNVELVLTAPRQELSGNYTVTIGGGICSGSSTFPAALTTRTYTGVLRMAGTAVSIELRGGADFTRRVAYGQFQGQEAWFTLKQFSAAYFDEGLWYQAPAVYPDFVERLPDGTLLGVSGLVIVRPSPEGLSGTLEGSLSIYDPSFSRVLSSCESKSHRFTLSR